MKPRLLVDTLICAAMVALPFTLGGGTEAQRMLVLGALYAAIAALGTTGVLSPATRDLLDTAAAVFVLFIAWFETFPAWGHSTEVGLYLLFGTLILKARDLTVAVATFLHHAPVTA